MSPFERIRDAVPVLLLAIPLLAMPLLAQAKEESAAAGPKRAEVEAWFGFYKTGLQSVAFRWDEGLIADIGPFTVPVDGGWHLSETPFKVEHRLIWSADSGAILFEEKHSERVHWRYEFELEIDTKEENGETVEVTRLLQHEFPPGGGDKVLVRAYNQQPLPEESAEQ